MDINRYMELLDRAEKLKNNTRIHGHLPAGMKALPSIAGGWHLWHIS